VDAGVGCAAAVINTALGRDSASCCCVIEPKTPAGSQGSCARPSQKSTCC
jgi:hypothetical protein